MTDRIAERSPLVYARVAGLAYVVTILLGIFSVSYIESNILVPGNDAATVDNIMNNELWFRISIASEFILYALVVLLSHALYVILKTVNRNLALLALLWRIGEAIIGVGVTVLTGLIPLLLLNGEAAFEQDQLHALVGLFLQVRSAGLDVVLIFIGMGGTLFCYLFFTAKYVPRILAAWGMITYLSMLILSLVSILTPNFPESVKMIFYAPGGLFEILFGFWLLIKGVNVEQWKKRALKSV
jgi:hypothetical protein